MSGAVIEAEGLTVHYPLRGTGFRHGVVKAVDGVNFTIAEGETLGVAGESGCGKTTLGRAILQIAPLTAGQFNISGTVVNERSRALPVVKKKAQMVFQDPQDSLNPRIKVGHILSESVAMAGVSPADRPYRVRELLETVGLPAEFALRYSHELSGGQRQRVGIARALGVGAKLIVCDEPVSSLDVSVRAQIMNLLRRLQRQYGYSYLFISHDMSTIRYLSHRLAVMYLGKFVEQGEVGGIFQRPLHPYTQALLASIPLAQPQANRDRVRVVIPGEVPSPVSPPSGCAFHPRCPIAQDVCRVQAPPLTPVGDGHHVACHFAQEGVWEGRGSVEP